MATRHRQPSKQSVWVSPRSVEHPLKGEEFSDGRDAQEVRPGFPGGRGAAGPGNRQAVVQVARDLGVNEGTLGNWVNSDRRRRDGGDGQLTEGERAELVRLRKENAELMMERVL